MARTIEAEETNSGFYCLPYNLGVSGDTAPDLVRRIDPEIKTRIYDDDSAETYQFVFAIGVNDSVQYTKDKANCYCNEEFLADINLLIEKARNFTNNISFISPIPVDDDLLMPMKWDEEKGYSNDSVIRFVNMLKKTCQEQDVEFFNLYEVWQAMANYKDYLIDGLHPNSAGHELMAKQIGEFLFTPEFEAFHAKC